MLADMTQMCTCVHIRMFLIQSNTADPNTALLVGMNENAYIDGLGQERCKPSA